MRNPESGIQRRDFFRLRPLANIGQIQFVRCDAGKRDSVERAVAGADAVVNCIGSFRGNLMRLMGGAPSGSKPCGTNAMIWDFQSTLPNLDSAGFACSSV